ncbi:MAG: MerR family transcriptional regulator [Alphaproteobacteria bacterium]|nr:MerR family transcriptional regulator [Alphaproteobacteria bacterium]
MGYSIGVVAKKTGLTTHTLRYYEKEGLLPYVKKNSAGQRAFSDTDLGWLSMIECLKETGMPLKGIKQYIDWDKEGNKTLNERLQMFQNHKKHIEDQIKKYQTYMQKIDYKIRLYTEAVNCGDLKQALQKVK